MYKHAAARGRLGECPRKGVYTVTMLLWTQVLRTAVGS